MITSQTSLSKEDKQNCSIDSNHNNNFPLQQPLAEIKDETIDMAVAMLSHGEMKERVSNPKQDDRLAILSRNDHKFSVSYGFRNKEENNNRKIKYPKGLEGQPYAYLPSSSGGILSIVSALNEGYAVSPSNFKDNHRKKDNIRKCGFWFGDVDNTKVVDGEKQYDPVLPIAEAIKIPFIAKHCLIYTSPSHKDGWDRFRVILPLRQDVDSLTYLAISQWMDKLLLGALDSSKYGGESLFYGNDNATWYISRDFEYHDYFWLGEVSRIAEAVKAEKEKEKQEKEAKKLARKEYQQQFKGARGDSDLEAKIEYLLDFIPPRQKGTGTYQDYRGIFTAVKNELGLERAVEIADNHSPEGGDWYQLLESSNGDFGIGTIVHFARLWGGFDPKTNDDWFKLNDFSQGGNTAKTLNLLPTRKAGKKLEAFLVGLATHIPPRDEKTTIGDDLKLYRAIANFIGVEKTAERFRKNLPMDEKWYQRLGYCPYQYGLRTIRKILSERGIDYENLPLWQSYVNQHKAPWKRELIEYLLDFIPSWNLPMDLMQPERISHHHDLLKVFVAVKNILNLDRAVMLAENHSPLYPFWRRDIESLEWLVGFDVIEKLATAWGFNPDRNPIHKEQYRAICSRVFEQELLEKHRQENRFTSDYVFDKPWVRDELSDNFIDELLSHHPLIALRSPKGTGKTTALKALQKRAHKMDLSLLVITPRVKLCAQASRDLSLNSIDSMAKRNGLIGIYNENGDDVVVTIDSTPLLEPYDWSRYIIVIDEAKQATEHLCLAKTHIKKIRPRAFSTLDKITKGCYGILLLDADMTDTVVDFWGDLSKKKPLKVENEYDKIKGDIEVEIFSGGMGSVSAFTTEMFSQSEQGKKVMYGTDSELDGIAKGNVAQKMGIKTVVISSTTLQEDPSLQRFLTNNGQAIIDEKIQLFIFTPVIQSGTSIHEGIDYFDSAFYKSVGVVTPTVFRQMQRRNRSFCKQYVHYRPRGLGYTNNFSTRQVLENKKQYVSDLVRYLSYYEKVGEIDSTVGLGDEVRAIVTEKPELTARVETWIAKLQANSNVDKRAWGAVYLDELQEENYTIEMNILVGGDKSLMNKIKKEKELITSEFAQKIFSAPVVSEKEFKSLKMKSHPTLEDRAKMEKFKINAVLPELELTEDFIHDYWLVDNGDTIFSIKNNFLANNQTLAETLSFNQLSSRVKQAFESQGVFLVENIAPLTYSKVWQAIEAENLFNPEKEYTNDTAKEVLDNLSNQTRTLLRTALSISWGKNSYFTAVLKKIGKVFGYKLIKKKQEKKVNIYSFVKQELQYFTDGQVEAFLEKNPKWENPLQQVEWWNNIFVSQEKKYSEKIEMEKSYFDPIVEKLKKQKSSASGTDSYGNSIYTKTEKCSGGSNAYPEPVSSPEDCSCPPTHNSDSQPDDFLNLNDEKIDLFTTNNNPDLSSNSGTNPEKSSAPYSDCQGIEDYPSQNEHLEGSNGGNEESITTEIKPSNLVTRVGQAIRFVVERWNGTSYIQTRVEQGVVKSMYGDSIEVESRGLSSWIRLSAILSVVQ